MSNRAVAICARSTVHSWRHAPPARSCVMRRNCAEDAMADVIGGSA
eukprot:CAMPEP_0185185678 /NCGR_PEP_ID=MMETSP1140-20130426/3484_1 /TAXON_ID=298111 /ORGANISM="Pavlova sp., Strain CCMP459" /LENGTH=45 /DNA_ID= /DNA_START= /DNA_END= /DNA_ORIENTATION=